MKKNIKIYTHLIALLALTVGVTSCNQDSFLKETLETERDLSYFNTEEGIQELAIGTYYYVFTKPFASEVQFGTTNYGTDEFHVGGDDTNSQWNNYDSRFNSSITTIRTTAEEPWDNAYLGIGYANQLIKSATDIESTNDAIKKTALGEGYFLRAFVYLKLARQYGGVPLKLEPSTSVELEFTRASVEEVLAQVISDFEMAYDLLDNSASTPNEITKDAAAHFLAKAYLTRASEINDSWNSSTKTADLQKVLDLSDEVIANHPLAGNYQDLWYYTQPDGANESLPELILSASFSRDAALDTYNQSHVYFTARYDDLAMMKRDLTGMRPYSRMACTYFTYDVFDHINDSRFWKTFRTKHRVNRGGESGGIAYTAGVDLGIMYVINSADDTRFAKTVNNNDPSILYSETGKTIPHVYVAHAADGVGLLANPRWPSLSKHFESDRTAINDNRGMRDEILARSAETYLMAAEAKIRMGDYSEALPYINAVRSRATYKSGEDRSYYMDGAESYPTSDYSQPLSDNSYMNENSYYESNNISETTAATSLTINSTSTLPDEDEAIITTLGYSSDYDRMMCLVLNERTRELCGEWLRWEDLSRTKTLVARVRAYNPEASANIQDYHNLRPIPQTFLDGIYTEGRPLTADEKSAMQNPGY
ncbi:RagB/SusD family nutrient uptake outer membrane protein [Mangrovibacterium diazotrophicum]|uniref:Putative outer membrane starch-binding protein n=1 Tax=Mangrovibacterium diazotrophicum TaxID=1261403 RepID=A0A419W5E1_9BACT|nr:RagB/SusD family nutrient uptake outer membrane protein [Mangrovibacterium diazotrophicum]RKD90664.1 putative outer membrane starch-binding protein [Mangrovibacterium diazotrophicum]